jgi:DNA polymerase-3 subunit gamma/tau
MIARAADGGLRDALSLTDQVLSLGESANVTPDRVREALGLVAEDEYLALLDLVAERRAGDVFGAVGRLADQGVDLGALLTGLADTLRAQLAIVLGGAPQGISERTRLALEERRERLSSADLLRMLNALVEIEPRFRKSGQQQLLLETLLVRFALVDRSVSLEELLRGFDEGGGSGGAGRPASSGASRQPNAPSSKPPDAYGASSSSFRDSAPMNRGAGGSPSATSTPASSASPASPSARMGAFAAASVASMTSSGAAAAHDAAGGGAVAATMEAPPARATRVAPSPAPAPAPVAPLATAARGAMLDLNTVVERWAEVSEVVRRNGRGFLATALDAALPVSITAAGSITLELEEANETFAKAIEAAREEILAAVRDVFGGGERIMLRPIEGAARGEPLQRITAESVKTDTVAMLRRRDAVLGAAVDALDLDLVE